MTVEEALQSLTDEQLAALVASFEMRGPGKKLLQQEIDRRAASAE